MGAKKPSAIPTEEETIKRLEELRADAAKLDTFVADTTANLLALDQGMETSQRETEVVAEKIDGLQEEHKSAARGLLAVLIAVNTIQENHSKEALSSDDSEVLEEHNRVGYTLDRAKTDLLAEITGHGLQREVLRNLETVNAGVLSDLTIARDTVLPEVCSMLTTLRMQQATAQGAALASSAQKIRGFTGERTVKALDATMEIARRVDTERVSGIKAIPESMRALAVALQTHMHHLEGAANREEDARKSLTTKGAEMLNRLTSGVSPLRIESDAIRPERTRVTHDTENTLNS